MGRLRTRFQSLLGNSKQVTVGDVILSELETLEKEVREEEERMKKEITTEKERGKRLLFLFQKDLMPGLNGMILESKDKRDEIVLKGTSRSAKSLAWLFLATINLGMLFYVLLFALNQDTHRQRAWSQSFGLWLVVEVMLVSTLSVLIMNVLIPSFLMKDVGNIKKKLVTNVINFYKEMAKNSDDSKAGEDKVEKNKVFNAAEYLFVSNRIAKGYSDLKLAKMILSFQTPWPKQSYQHMSDVSKKYDRKFSTITRSLSIVILFFLSSLLSVPISVQDMIIHMTSTVTLGYTVLFHLQLYKIFPVLVIIPTIFIGLIIHFMLRANRAKKKQEELNLLNEIKEINDKDKLSLVAVENSPNSPVHRRRRESLQNAISLATRLNHLLNPDLPQKSSDDDDDLDESLDSSISDPRNAIRAFQRTAKKFNKHVKSDDENKVDDDDDDAELYNLHLAVGSKDQRALPYYVDAHPIDQDDNDSLDLSQQSEDGDDDSLDDAIKSQALKIISLKNSTVASRFLGLIDNRRRSYENELKENDEDDNDDDIDIDLDDDDDAEENEEDDKFEEKDHRNFNDLNKSIFLNERSYKNKQTLPRASLQSNNSDVSSISFGTVDLPGFGTTPPKQPMKIDEAISHHSFSDVSSLH